MVLTACDERAPSRALGVVVLAAGRGTRMRDALPKGLHTVAGVPMLVHVVRAALSLVPHRVVIVYATAAQKAAFSSALSAHMPADCTAHLQWAQQVDLCGTGHAVRQAMPILVASMSPEQQAHLQVLVLYADVPLLQAATLATLVDRKPYPGIGVLTFSPSDPTGLGRILRDEAGQLCAIVEEKEADAAQKRIQEVSSGILVADYPLLSRYLPRVSCSNAQQEYYLPDVIALAVQDGHAVIGLHSKSSDACMGVNDKAALAKAERVYQARMAETLMREHGVSIQDPARFDCRAQLQVGHGVRIDINVVLLGAVVLGDNVSIGPGVVLKDVIVGSNTVIRAHSVLEDSQIEAGCVLGPFAYLRGGCHLGDDTQIGCFVEAKHVRTGKGSKAKHLSYLGDAVIGHHVNVGAGVITCNYNGYEKAATHIEDHAFIGSASQLIAPVTVGAHAYVGAGSTVTKSVPAAALALSRVVQRVIPNWVTKRCGKRKEKSGSLG